MQDREFNFVCRTLSRNRHQRFKVALAVSTQVAPDPAALLESRELTVLKRSATVACKCFVIGQLLGECFGLHGGQCRPVLGGATDQQKTAGDGEKHEQYFHRFFPVDRSGLIGVRPLKHLALIFRPADSSNVQIVYAIPTRIPLR